jgi:hypothetical protein
MKNNVELGMGVASPASGDIYLKTPFFKFLDDVISIGWAFIEYCEN